LVMAGGQAKRVSGGGDADGAGMAAVAGLAGARANGSSRSEQVRQAVRAYLRTRLV
ncbi:ribbon-helix-helix protein, CopG family, partial [Pseudomonas aeruginosa]